MSDPREIYLQPECCADETYGRLWCEDDAPEVCEEGRPWTKYVIAEEYERLRELYHDLLMSVGNKYEGETRHQTALRYIKRAEEVEVFEGSEKAALGKEKQNGE